MNSDFVLGQRRVSGSGGPFVNLGLAIQYFMTTMILLTPSLLKDLKESPLRERKDISRLKLKMISSGYY